MYTNADTCSKANTHLSFNYCTLTISRKQECIMLGVHGSLKSQINTLIHMKSMLLWVWEVTIMLYPLCLSDEVYILVCSKWSCEWVCVYSVSCGSEDELTFGIFSSAVVRSRVCVLQAIFVCLGVQILPLREICLTRPSANGACSVLDHVHQVQCTNSLKIKQPT